MDRVRLGGQLYCGRIWGAEKQCIKECRSVFGVKWFCLRPGVPRPQHHTLTKTIRVLEMCGFLALVPEASKTNLAKNNSGMPLIAWARCGAEHVYNPGLVGSWPAPMRDPHPAGPKDVRKVWLRRRAFDQHRARARLGGHSASLRAAHLSKEVD